MSKVKLDSIKPWITKKLTEILKLEDDVVVEFVFNQLEEKVRDWSIYLILLEIDLLINTLISLWNIPVDSNLVTTIPNE